MHRQGNLCFHRNRGISICHPIRFRNRISRKPYMRGRNSIIIVTIETLNACRKGFSGGSGQGTVLGKPEGNAADAQFREFSGNGIEYFVLVHLEQLNPARVLGLDEYDAVPDVGWP